MIALLLIGGARADLASSPDDCPPGSYGVTSHSPYCAPSFCDERCEGECRVVGLCVRPKEVFPFGLSISVEGLCAGQGDCPLDQACSVASRCVSEDTVFPEPSPSEDEAGGCGTATAQPPLVAFLASLTLLALRRRSA